MLSRNRILLNLAGTENIKHNSAYIVGGVYFYCSGIVSLGLCAYNHKFLYEDRKEYFRSVYLDWKSNSSIQNLAQFSQNFCFYEFCMCLKFIYTWCFLPLVLYDLKYRTTEKDNYVGYKHIVPLSDKNSKRLAHLARKKA